MGFQSPFFKQLKIRPSDCRRVAREMMDNGGFGYYQGGATDEWTLKENRSAFEKFRIIPRVLVPVTPLGGEICKALRWLGSFEVKKSPWELIRALRCFVIKTRVATHLELCLWAMLRQSDNTKPREENLRTTSHHSTELEHHKSHHTIEFQPVEKIIPRRSLASPRFERRQEALGQKENPRRGPQVDGFIFPFTNRYLLG